jgi:hypothetical protein
VVACTACVIVGNPRISTSIHVLLVEIMVQNITTVISDYEERLRSLQKGPIFSYRRRMLRWDGAPNRALYSLFSEQRSPVIMFRLEF